MNHEGSKLSKGHEETGTWLAKREKNHSVGFDPSIVPPGRMRLRDLPDDVNDLSAIVFDAAIEVHTALGNRLAEKTYRDCLAHELRVRGERADVEAPIASWSN